MTGPQDNEQPGSEDLQRSMSALYRGFYAELGDLRNDLLRNPQVMFQSFATERSLISSLRRLQLDRQSARVLDVGCGSGGGLLGLLRYGFDPDNLTGIDLLEGRVAAARHRLPGVRLLAGDARTMPFADGEFDLVMESTMFINITEEGIAKPIAAEMVRVTRPGGHIVLTDWRFSKPGREGYLAVTRKRIHYLFDVGTKTDVEAVASGALVPPIGRLLSHRTPWLYFLVSGIFPFLVGQKTTVLRKRGGPEAASAGHRT